MPYKLQKVGQGYKICSPSRCFSSRPLNKETALRQLAAIQIHSRKGGETMDSDAEDLNDEINGGEGESSDSSLSDSETEVILAKEEMKKKKRRRNKRKSKDDSKEKKDKADENALDKIDKKEEIVEMKKKKKSKLRSGIKKVGSLIKGFIHFVDKALEGTIETIGNLGSIPETASSETKSSVQRKKDEIEERVAKAEIHYAVPLYDVIVKNLYDKLGWMLLAKKLGKYDKVKVYKNEIKDTLESMRNLAPVVSPKEKEALNTHYQRLLVLYEETTVLL